MNSHTAYSTFVRHLIKILFVIWVILLAMIVLSGCGGGNDFPDPEPEPEPVPTEVIYAPEFKTIMPVACKASGSCI